MGEKIEWEPSLGKFVGTTTNILQYTGWNMVNSKCLDQVSPDAIHFFQLWILGSAPLLKDSQVGEGKATQDRELRLSGLIWRSSVPSPISYFEMEKKK